MNDWHPDYDDEQLICGAAEMFLRRHGPPTSDMLAARISALEEDEQLVGALYRAIAARVGEMDRSSASH